MSNAQLGDEGMRCHMYIHAHAQINHAYESVHHAIDICIFVFGDFAHG